MVIHTYCNCIKQFTHVQYEIKKTHYIYTAIRFNIICTYLQCIYTLCVSNGITNKSPTQNYSCQFHDWVGQRHPTR